MFRFNATNEFRKYMKVHSCGIRRSPGVSIRREAPSGAAAHCTAAQLCARASSQSAAVRRQPSGGVSGRYIRVRTSQEELVRTRSLLGRSRSARALLLVAGGPGNLLCEARLHRGDGLAEAIAEALLEFGPLGGQIVVVPLSDEAVAADLLRKRGDTDGVAV